MQRCYYWCRGSHNSEHCVRWLYLCHHSLLLFISCWFDQFIHYFGVCCVYSSHRNGCTNRSGFCL